MAGRIRRSFEAITRRVNQRVRVTDLPTSECACQEVIRTPGSHIVLGALTSGYVQLGHWPRGPRQILDYNLAVYTKTNACVEIEGTDHLSPLALSWQKHAKERKPTLSSCTDQRVGVIFDRWIGNFYHWMVFSVPKLILLHNIFEVQKFFLPNDLAPIPPFVWQTLELLGLPQEAVIPISRGIHQASELCFVHGAGPSPFSCQLTRRKLGSEVCGGHAAEKKNLYLVRKANTSTRRSLVNESDIRHLCTEVGIEAVDPGALSLREQIALFQNVDLVIGVHGAALANMLWMPPGSKVIEIATGTQPHYRALAENLGLNWISLLARRTDTSVAGHNGDFVVNVKALEKLLKLYG